MLEDAGFGIWLASHREDNGKFTLILLVKLSACYVLTGIRIGAKNQNFIRMMFYRLEETQRHFRIIEKAGHV